jgi:hypothetical protein
MYNYEHLSNLTNSELVALANDPIRRNTASDSDKNKLILYLAERLEELDYMVEATLDGQTPEI